MFPTKFRGLRAVPATAAAAGTVALAVLTAACGSSGSSSVSATQTAGTGTASASAVSGSATSASAASSATSVAAGGGSSSASAGTGAATLTGAAASALATKALTNTQDASSVRVAGTSASGSQHVTFALTLVKNAGCQGTIALSKTESFQIVETGGYAWLLPTDAFYASQHLSKAALALVQDKYIKVKTTDSQVGDLTKICSFSGLFGSLPKVTGTGYTATPVTYLGRSAYKLTQAGSNGSAYFTNSATPLLLVISDPASDGGVITFGNYDAVTTITAPTAAESIDGSELGL